MSQNTESYLIKTEEESMGVSQITKSFIELDRFGEYISNLVGIKSSDNPYLYPGLSATPWYTTNNFEFTKILENSYGIIKDELFNIRHSNGLQPEKQVKRSGYWNIYSFYHRGEKNEKNCSSCPETTKIIESIPSIRTLGGLIYFSALTPGTYIYPHKGPTNLRLRCHLGLDIPESCGIRVGDETRTWEEGKCLLFDDSFTHEAWNNGKRTRIVLVIDIWHPDLTDFEIQAIEGLHKYIYFHAKQLWHFWDNNELKTNEKQEKY